MYRSPVSYCTKSACLQKINYNNLSLTGIPVCPSWSTGKCCFVRSYPKFFLWEIQTNKLETSWCQFSFMIIHKLHVHYVFMFLFRRFLNPQSNVLLKAVEVLSICIGELVFFLRFWRKKIHFTFKWIWIFFLFLIWKT